MADKYSNWIENPTPKQFLLVNVLWCVAIVLLILAITDVFTESPFQTKNASVLMLILMSSFAVFRVHKNYRKK